jgi:hypothetical protein
MISGGCSGTVSFVAAGSGGAIIDLDGISGIAGVGTDAFASADALETACVAGFCSG